MIFEGNIAAAARLAAEKIQSERINGMMFQPVGDLHLEFPGHQIVQNYYRELNLENAVAKTKYTVGNVQFTRETFISLTDQVIVMRLTADKPASLSFNASLSSPQQSAVTSTDHDEIILSGISGDHDGVKGLVRFRSVIKIKTSGGKTTVKDNTLEIVHADTATVFISIASNFVNYENLSADENKKAVDYLASAERKSYAQLLNDHIRAYQHYF
ncbi:MAG: glycoside hydrolase family 95 protein [Puia sp.]